MAKCNYDCFNCKYPDCRATGIEAALGLHVDDYIRPHKRAEEMTGEALERLEQRQEYMRRWRELKAEKEAERRADEAAKKQVQRAKNKR